MSFTEEDKIQIAQYVERMSNQTQLELWDEGIDAHHAWLFAEALKSNQTLQKLNLGGNNFGFEGIKYITEAIKDNNTLTELSLGYNNICAQGALAIADVLKLNHSLKKLNVNDNNIGDEGAEAIAEGLSLNCTLTYIDLDSNNVGDVGAQKIAEALKVNRTLTVLQFWKNNIGDKGARAIADALKVEENDSHSLLKLNLESNRIGDVGACCLARALKVNHSLIKLNLYDNFIDEIGSQSITNAIVHNPTLIELYGVDLNKYLNIPPHPAEFVNKDNNEILSYLKELHQSQSQPQEIFRMRVMLVGPGNAGKTTLIHRLMTGEFKAGQFGMTDGILMNDWKPKETNVHLSFWDFGGQEMYLNSHPMLFSEQTLYLLVWNPRAETPIHKLEEYLLNIRSKSKTSPILLVTTHSLEAKPPLLDGILRKLGEYPGCVGHYSVDSRAEEGGIDELKEGLINFVKKNEDCAKYSRVFVPSWYVKLEKSLREIRGEISEVGTSEGQSESKGSVDNEKTLKFFLSQQELIEEIRSLWKFDPIQSHGDEEEESTQVSKVLRLFHHWGIIYVLPQIDVGRYDGDIILFPQKLADVLKCVITCKTDSLTAHSPTKDHQTRRNFSDEIRCKLKELFEQGILSHEEELVGFVWGDYPCRLHSQFLKLLHDNELAFEIFNDRSEPTNQSLVPCLLRDLGVETMKEKDIRKEFLCEKETIETPILRQCSVSVKFDCLLPNFFPKLMVRLRHLIVSPSSTEINRTFSQSRHHFVVMVGNSVCCVVEDRRSHTLILYPGLNTLCVNSNTNTHSNTLSLPSTIFDASFICNSVIQGLLDEMFSGAKIDDVLLKIGQDFFTAEGLLYFLKNDPNCSYLIPSTGQSVKFSITFLTPFFQNKSISPPCFDSDIEPGHISSLRRKLSQFREEPDLMNRHGLSISLARSIPFFREKLLKVPPSPGVMWLVGQKVDQSNPNDLNMILIALSPSIDPCVNWELLYETQVEVSIPRSESSSSDNISFSSISSLVDLFLDCLKNLLSTGRLQTDPKSLNWIGCLPFQIFDGVFLSNSSSIVQTCFERMKMNEKEFFMMDKDLFGEMVWYSKMALEQQRVNVMLEVVKMRKEMFEGLEEVKQVVVEAALMVQNDISLIKEEN